MKKRSPPGYKPGGDDQTVNQLTTSASLPARLLQHLLMLLFAHALAALLNQ
jgi:hypothetical protein